MENNQSKNSFQFIPCAMRFISVICELTKPNMKKSWRRRRRTEHTADVPLILPRVWYFLPGIKMNAYYDTLGDTRFSFYKHHRESIMQFIKISGISGISRDIKEFLTKVHKISPSELFLGKNMKKKRFIVLFWYFLLWQCNTQSLGSGFKNTFRNKKH